VAPGRFECGGTGSRRKSRSVIRRARARPATGIAPVSRASSSNVETGGTCRDRFALLAGPFGRRNSKDHRNECSCNQSARVPGPSKNESATGKDRSANNVMKDVDLDRLLRAAAQTKEDAPAEMPFGFDTRVVALSRRNGNGALFGALLRRVAFAATAVIVLASPGPYFQFNRNGDLSTAGSELAIAASD